MGGPLDGFRVIELATMVSAPIATMLLADQGAEVIKVEAPPHGDIMRRLGPQRGGVTAGFATINRGKRSLVLDLKHERGIGILHDLVGTADVFVQNFRPGVVDRLDLGADRLRELNPRLVYVSISGFGQDGPYAQKRVYDPIIQALSGVADIQADRVTGEPKMVRTIIPDKVTGLTAAQAITAALLARERTGEGQHLGQHLEIAMLDATISFVWPEGFVRQILVGGEVAHGRPGSTSDLIYKTADGYITASTISDAEWEGMAASPVLGEGAEDLLGGLGLSAAEIEALRREKIVG